MPRLAGDQRIEGDVLPASRRPSRGDLVRLNAEQVETITRL
ncbi:hypothetical protein [Streptomyces sp. B8F3]